MKEYFKQDLSLEDNLGDWQMLTTPTQSIWVKCIRNSFLPDTIMPVDPYGLLTYLKSILNYEYLVSSASLFENNNKLSTQVPMHHIYYTECKDLLEWNEHLGNTITIRYFEHAWELERLQKLVLASRT